MNLIVVVDEKFGIGKDNDLLFKLPTDMKFFKEMTLGKTVVMGKKTFMSLPFGPLKGRENVILSRDPDFKCDGAVVCNSIEQVIDYCKDREAFVIGGQQIYHTFLPYCKKAYVTKVSANGNADKFMDNFDELPSWKLTEKSEVFRDGNLDICFCVYTNLTTKSKQR